MIKKTPVLFQNVRLQKSGLSLADIGCGTGQTTSVFARSERVASVRGFDVSTAQVDMANKINATGKVTFE